MDNQEGGIILNIENEGKIQTYQYKLEPDGEFPLYEKELSNKPEKFDVVSKAEEDESLLSTLEDQYDSNLLHNISNPQIFVKIIGVEKEGALPGLKRR